jgi:aminopeptidase-like protein
VGGRVRALAGLGVTGAVGQPLRDLGRGDAGVRLHEFIQELYPICRSLTGEGVRATLRRVRARIPLEIHEVPTGTPVFDWTVPREWNIRDAYINGPSGERVLSFADSNLHVMGYSIPVHDRMSLAALRERLFTLPDRPEWIPYRTSYYAENWGFCLAHSRLQELADGEYEVCIDSTLADGHLTYGECVLPGEEDDEILISAHVCHPALCNDNLSGVAIATLLAQALGSSPRRYTYRFLFIPGTIGSITWLSMNAKAVSRIRHGLVLTCVGDGGLSTYKRSRRGDSEIDQVMEYVLAASGEPFEVEDFSPWGYDERQYCSPGINLPVGCLMRTPHGRFPQYHTSADDLDFVTPAGLADSFAKCLSAFDVLERNGVYLNLSPMGEPQLGRRGLYGAVGGQSDKRRIEMAMLWVLNMSDGKHSLLEVATRSGLDFDSIAAAAQLLIQHELLKLVRSDAWVADELA